ncbi:MAG TPA: PEGA domain-containing protein [Kofleriaceae bacterium]|nr:PEGA domain-containing protein [Kofleriaceae bacterium]
MALRYLTALMGGALTVLGLCVAPAPADAKPYAVRIESQPSGATVYLDSKEGDPLGQTPYTGKLAAGPHTLIVELDGYVSQVQDITIKKQRRVQRIAVRLSKIDLAIIEVVQEKGGGRTDPGVKGARILVDGREVGTLPSTIKVPAGPHQVEVVQDGYKGFETWVEAAEGEKLVVAAELVPLGGAGRSRAKVGAVEDVDPEDDPIGEEEERLAAAEQQALRRKGSDPEASVSEKQADAGRQIPYVMLGAGFELGGRRFRPDSQDVQGGLRQYDAGGVPMVRLTAEVNPLAFSPSKLVSGWGVFASYARAMPLDSAARLMDGTEVDVPTEWSELDLGLRYRFRFRPDSYLGAEVGYGSHTFTFEFSEQTESLAVEVPDVDYGFWRLGLEGRLGFGDRFAALASGGTRLVNSIGELGERFAQTDVVAFNAGFGMAATLTSSIEARLVGRYDHYSHEYTAGAAPGPGTAATSGVDQFFGAMLSALFVY